MNRDELSKPNFQQTPSFIKLGACFIYDALAVIALCFVSALAVIILIGDASHGLKRYLLQIVLWLAIGIYFVWCWKKTGQTLAMKTWHIRVLDTSGRPLSQARAFWRYLLSWVWILPPMLITAPLQLPATEVAVLVLGWILIWAVLSRFQSRGQYWHDVWAGSQLVDVQKPAAPTTSASNS
mgnify:CR=1 FL=1